MSVANITGSITFPDAPYPVPPILVNQEVEFAKVALAGLLSHMEGRLMTDPELADRAWDIAREMKAAASRRGIYL